MEEPAAKLREKEEKGSVKGAVGGRRLLAVVVEKGGDGGRTKGEVREKERKKKIEGEKKERKKMEN